MTAISASYNEILQHDADLYFQEHPLATTAELAMWAISTGRWEPPQDLILRRCREDFARALREQYITDDDGQSVRAKHAARTTRGDHQETFWGDIRTAPVSHMRVAFQQRREQIVGDCRQLSRDVEYFNKKRSESVQLVFDFRDDIEEGKFPSRL